jgi:hypothetical protein
MIFHFTLVFALILFILSACALQAEVSQISASTFSPTHSQSPTISYSYNIFSNPLLRGWTPTHAEEIIVLASYQPDITPNLQSLKPGTNPMIDLSLSATTSTKSRSFYEMAAYQKSHQVINFQGTPKPNFAAYLLNYKIPCTSVRNIGIEKSKLILNTLEATKEK